MKVVILDTETTGFEANRNQIAQLAYLVIIDGKVKAKNFFFTVDKMDKGAENTHGFSMEKLKLLSNGKRFSHYSEEIFLDLDEAMIVCHNLQFDIPFIQNEFERIGIRINPPNTFCTMEYYTDILKLKGKYGYKWPKLTEVLDYYGISNLDISRKMNVLFGETAGAHDARWDIIATMEIYNRIGDIQNTIRKTNNNKITKDVEVNGYSKKGNILNTINVLTDNILNIIGRLFPIACIIFIILGFWESDGSSSSSPEYQEEMYIAQQEALIEDHIEEQKYQEYEDAENEFWATELYYINNGYYYHTDRNCEGLKGYENVNITYYDELLDHPELKPCNWCN